VRLRGHGRGQPFVNSTSRRFIGPGCYAAHPLPKPRPTPLDSRGLAPTIGESDPNHFEPDFRALAREVACRLKLLPTPLEGSNPSLFAPAPSLLVGERRGDESQNCPVTASAAELGPSAGLTPTLVLAEPRTKNDNVMVAAPSTAVEAKRMFVIF